MVLFDKTEILLSDAIQLCAYIFVKISIENIVKNITKNWKKNCTLLFTNLYVWVKVQTPKLQLKTCTDLKYIIVCLCNICYIPFIYRHCFPMRLICGSYAAMLINRYANSHGEEIRIDKFIFLSKFLYVLVCGYNIIEYIKMIYIWLHIKYDIQLTEFLFAAYVSGRHVPRRI